LKAESVEEETEVDDVAFSTVGVGLGSGRPSVGANEGSVDVVEHISPHFANPCIKGLNLRVRDQQREILKELKIQRVRGPNQEHQARSQIQKKRLTCSSSREQSECH
jgi:hypothetical protein